MLRLLLHSYGTHCDHILWHLMATMTAVAPPVDCLWQFGSSFYRCRCKLRGPQNIISPTPHSLLKYTRVMANGLLRKRATTTTTTKTCCRWKIIPLCVCVFSEEKCVTKRPFCWLVAHFCQMNEVLEMCVGGRYSHAP